jgi:hypothetical protein
VDPLRNFHGYFRHASTNDQGGHLDQRIRIPPITEGGPAKDFGQVRARELEPLAVEGLLRRFLRVVGEELVAKPLEKVMAAGPWKASIAANAGSALKTPSRRWQGESSEKTIARSRESP